MLKTMLPLIAAVLPSISVARATVSASTGGLLIPNVKKTYYLETRQSTEITYSNRLIGKEAIVELEYGMRSMRVDKSGNRIDSNWDSPAKIPMEPAGKGAWKVHLDQTRHGLGGTSKAYGINFVFHVVYPGQEGVLDTCAEDKVYSVDFQRMSDLTWRKHPDQTPVLEKTIVDCVWSDAE